MNKNCRKSNGLFSEGMGETRFLEVTYYNEGFYETFEGFAVHFDQQTKRLKLEDTAGSSIGCRLTQS